MCTDLDFFLIWCFFLPMAFQKLEQTSTAGFKLFSANIDKWLVFKNCFPRVYNC